jgi:hypothetical protein
MDTIFEILEKAGNPTTQQHRSKWSQVKEDLKRSGLCICCGHNPTVQRSCMGIKPIPGHPCYKQNICLPCYKYEQDRPNPICWRKTIYNRNLGIEVRSSYPRRRTEHEQPPFDHVNFNNGHRSFTDEHVPPRRQDTIICGNNHQALFTSRRTKNISRRGGRKRFCSF